MYKISDENGFNQAIYRAKDLKTRFKTGFKIHSYLPHYFNILLFYYLH